MLFSSLPFHCGIWDDSCLISSWVVGSYRCLPTELLKVRKLPVLSLYCPWTEKYCDLSLGVRESFHHSCTTFDSLTLWSWLRHTTQTLLVGGNILILFQSPNPFAGCHCPILVLILSRMATRILSLLLLKPILSKSYFLASNFPLSFSDKGSGWSGIF